MRYCKLMNILNPLALTRTSKAPCSIKRLVATINKTTQHQNTKDQNLKHTQP